MTDHTARIRPISEDQGNEAAALMARAFQDDPLFVYGCPDPDVRRRWLPWLFRWSVWRGFYHGATLGIANDTGVIAGVAATIGPAGGELSEAELVLFGYGRGREEIGAEVWDRATGTLNPVFEAVDAILHAAVPEPNWYLDVLAVEPARQGSGLGSRLVSTVNARADADGVPAVLLTYQARNLPFYQRHGYQIVCSGTEPTSGLDWWGFRREPGTPPR